MLHAFNYTSHNCIRKPEIRTWGKDSASTAQEAGGERGNLQGLQIKAVGGRGS